MKKFVLFFFGFFSWMLSHAQTDTAFWFVAPEVTTTHGDRPIFLRFTALEQAATVTVSIPANSSFFAQTIFVPANSSRSIDLTNYIDIIENKPADQKLNHGLLIQSSAFITAYYEVARPNNTDIFSLKGRNALGTDFLIPSQNIMYNVTFTPPAYSSFEIVATEDNTHITITPSNNITGHQAGETFTITLNKGETYSCASAGTAASQHLMGSVVKSDKPIAITVKDDSMSGGGYGGCYDLGGDQLVPVPLAGNKYITLPGYLNIPSTQPTDNIFILAIEDNTTVNINGAFATTLQRGQTFLKQSFNNVFYIETSKPVYVYQLSGFGCEVGESLLPQIECTGSKTVGFTRSTQEPLYMNIIVPTGGEGSFTFNGGAGTISAGQFSTVPFTNGEWKYARIQLSLGQLSEGGAAIVKNSLKAFQLSIIHGDAQTGCRYGYFSNYNSLDASASVNVPANGSLCKGETLRLFCDVRGEEQTSFLWTGPNGFTSALQNPMIENVTTANAGEYRCIVSKAGCTTDTTTIIAEIYDYPTNVNASSNAPLCQGQQLKLFAADAGNNVQYTWAGPNGFISDVQNPVLTTTNNNSGNYILTASRKSCAVKDTLAVQVDVNPGSHPFSGSPYCSEDSIVLNTTIPPNAINNNAVFLWTGPNGFTSNNQRVVIYNAQPNQSGIYTLKVNAPACGDSVASTTVSITQSPIAAASFAAPLCENGRLQLNAANTLPGTLFSWIGPNNFTSSTQNPVINNVSVTASGDYILKTSLSVCATSDTISIVVNRIPSAFISANAATTCEYKQIVITNNNTVPNTSYQWTGPNGFTSSQQNVTIDNATPANAGTYLLIASSNGCKDTAAVDIDVKASPLISFPSLTNLCQEANAFQINGVSETTGISGAGIFGGNGVNATGFFDPLLAGSGTHFIRYTFTADNGCDNYAEQPVTVFPTPVINAGDDKVIIQGSIIKLNATVTGNIKTLQWIPPTYLDNSAIQNPNATPQADILYKLHVVSTDNCTADDSVFIKVLAKIGIPNAFSPNKDGINDKWVLDGLASFPASKLVVYNRYGQAVFTSTGYGTSWDGTYKNNPLPVGTYYYVLHLNDGYRKEPITGWVAILR